MGFRPCAGSPKPALWRAQLAVVIRTLEVNVPSGVPGDFMFLGLFVILLILWLLGFFAFHIAGGLIHLLIIVAVISLVLHLVRGRS